MNTLGENEQIHIVTYALSELINRAIHKLQAFVAFRDNYPQRVDLLIKKDWYALAYTSILENLLINVASLTDRAQYCTKGSVETNCSFKELRYVLENSEDSKKKYQSIINAIDVLLSTYGDVVPDILRNKVLAHKDLDELFNWRDYNLNLIEITRFLIEGSKILSDVFEVRFGVHMKTPDLESIKKNYEESLKTPL